MRRSIFTACLTVALVVGFGGTASASNIFNYVASTGQTATADFSFTSGTSLNIILSETTPAAASSLTGADAILTSIGFLLPDSAFIAGGLVTVCSAAICGGNNSQSVGFATTGGGPPAQVFLFDGADTTGEWGATIGGEQPIDSIGMFDFVSVNNAQVTPFGGTNRDAGVGLNGPQGGLLDDSAARGGLGVIDNAVNIQLTLGGGAGGGALTPAQQDAFINSLSTNSVVEYGSDAAFGVPVVPEPGTLLLIGSGLVGLVVGARRRHRRQ